MGKFTGAVVRIAIDIDGTIDSNPREFQSMMSAFLAAGHIVSVVTGTSDGPPDQNEFDAKANYLSNLGCSECWSDMTVLSHAGSVDLADVKAQWCVDNHVDVLCDNTIENVKAASKAGVPLVLVPWASRIKDSK